MKSTRASTRKPFTPQSFAACIAVAVVASTNATFEARAASPAPNLNGSKVAAATKAATTAATTPATPKGSWFGRLPGSDAFVAVVSDGKEVTAYLCDSKTISAWFRGLGNGGSTTLENTAGQRLRVALNSSAPTVAFSGPSSAERTVPLSRVQNRPVLFRAETSAAAGLLAGWVVSPTGEQRGAINGGIVGRSPTISPAPNLNLGQQIGSIPSGSIPAVFLQPGNGAKPAQVSPSAVVEDQVNPPTGHSEFVFLALGDSYGAGEGNPSSLANNAVQTVTPGAGALVGAAIGGIVLGPFGALGGAALGALVGVPRPQTTAADPDALLGTKENVERWGPPGAPDESLRTLCHRSSESPSEKIAAMIRRDYPAMNMRFYNFACSGAQARHLSNTSYDGTETKRDLAPDLRSLNHGGTGSNQLPAQALQARAFLGDTSAATSAARQLLSNAGVMPTGALAVSVPHIDAMYTSGGGNDSGFSTVVKDCAIAPFPDCTVQSDTFSKVQNGNGGSADDDNTFFGTNALGGGLDTVGATIAALSVQRGGQTFPVRPTKVYAADYPNPARRDSASGPFCSPTGSRLANDTLGNFTATDAALGERVLLLMNDAIRGAAGRNQWAIIENQDAFAGHGVCEDDAFINSGTDGLRGQGNDLGFDGVFEVSGGIMHPNDGGYTAMAQNGYAVMRDQINAFVAGTGEPLAKPTRLRQVAATQNGAITIRWDDKSSAETAYLVFRRPGVQGSTANFTLVTTAALPADSQELTDNPGSGAFQYLVVACNTACTVPIQPNAQSVAPGANVSPTVVAVNVPPVTPSNVTSTPSVVPELQRPGQIGTSTTGVSQLAWAADVRNTTYTLIMRTTATGAETTHTGLTQAGVTVGSSPLPVVAFPISGDEFRVRGCNVLGCSATSDPATPIIVGQGSNSSLLTIPSVPVAIDPNRVPNLDPTIPGLTNTIPKPGGTIPLPPNRGSRPRPGPSRP